MKIKDRAAVALYPKQLANGVTRGPELAALIVRTAHANGVHWIEEDAVNAFGSMHRHKILPAMHDAQIRQTDSYFKTQYSSPSELRSPWIYSIRYR